MISVAEAQEIILSHCEILEAEVVPFEEALNRTLSDDVLAADPLPPFPASIKDG
jgi:molybdopterin biosynthesis enzyme